MDPPRLRCIVSVADGTSRRVGPSGLLVGRQPDCDIVATDPSVSRRHALVHLTADGVELVPLGRAPVELNGTPITEETLLADRDEIRIPGLALRVEIEESSGFERLDAEARNAVQRALFKPWTENGRARQAVVLVPIEFGLTRRTSSG